MDALEKIRAALADGKYEAGKRSSRPGRRYGILSTGQLIALMAGDVLALCAAIKAPDQVCRDIARGVGSLKPDTVVRLESDDVHHLVRLAGPVKIVPVTESVGGILIPGGGDGGPAITGSGNAGERPQGAVQPDRDLPPSQ